ncbi:uncharacterized protein [Clytia hemisphaerica]|uniref:Uncharacterized protein n=1 Tax=Clytia hemisphaerica TaxID=252671 RepID=A0A7M5WZY4_9CNID
MISTDTRGPKECNALFNGFVSQQGIGADQHFCAETNTAFGLIGDTVLFLYVLIKATTIHKAAEKCDQSRWVELNPRAFAVETIQEAFINLLSKNGLREAVEFSANKFCYVKKIDQDGHTIVDCSKEAPRYYLCRYERVDEFWPSIIGVPLDQNGDYEILVEEGTSGNDGITDDFLGAKKRCEARGKELLTIESAAKMETVTDLINNFVPPPGIFPINIFEIWVALTLDPLAGKITSCNKDILPNFRPWCPFGDQLTADDGGLCILFFRFSKCFPIPASKCGAAPSISTICQKPSAISTIREYVRVARKEIGNIKRDCSSCKMKQ